MLFRELCPILRTGVRKETNKPRQWRRLYSRMQGTAALGISAARGTSQE
jgi:hypothetical protein